MSDKEDRERLIKETTNEALTSQFIKQAGSKARVERTDLEGEHLDHLREVIEEVGKDLVETGIVPKGMEYLGSMTVHVYKSEIMKTAAFLSLNNMKDLHPSLADGALRELNGKVKEYYGQKRQKLRSGF